MISFLNNNYALILPLFFLGAFLFTYYLTPKIINVVKHKDLMDAPNNRSSHKDITPTFGGIAFFMVVVFTLFFAKEIDTFNISLNIIAGATILLFSGLKDDLVVLSSTSKFISQIAAVSLLIYGTSLYEFNFNNFFYLGNVSGLVGFFTTLFIMLSIINAINLIDGIDGLAASIGIIILTFYSLIFFHLKNYFVAVLCISLIGSLAAFLRFNLSSDKKIFMGDTGSLILGLTIGYISLLFLNLDIPDLEQLPFKQHNSPLVVVSILIFPLYDMARVFFSRLSKGKSPLSADKSHTHHILLEIGNTHKKSTIIISLVSVFFTLVFLYFTSILNKSWLIILIFVLFFILFYWFIMRISSRKK